MTLIRRLTHNYIEIQKSPPPLCYAEPKDPSKDMIHWIGWIEGAEETPYTGGKFHLSIDFPSDFPFKPPRIKFLTPIYHPNIKEFIQIISDKLDENSIGIMTKSFRNTRFDVDELRGSLPLPTTILQNMLLTQPNSTDKQKIIEKENIKGVIAGT
ncbi:unnamed protein product [Adineta steineri]|uniref:UBC core domain-containing protein n=1 Tax=Adineta steineri TaxID=433720 RepID=A0A813UR77_9BILA|nr:unnamed protein product [Adineta steineri]